MGLVKASAGKATSVTGVKAGIVAALTGVKAGVTRVVAAVTGVEAGVTGVVAAVTEVMVFVEGPGVVIELVSKVAGVMEFLGGGANPSSCTAFGLISVASISASVFVLFKLLSNFSDFIPNLITYSVLVSS